MCGVEQEQHRGARCSVIGPLVLKIAIRTELRTLGRLYGVMDSQSTEIDRLKQDLALDEALIHALYLRLKSEIETRHAIVDAAAHGAGVEVLEAIAADPVPIIDELGAEKTVAGLIDAYRRARAERGSDIFDIAH